MFVRTAQPLARPALDRPPYVKRYALTRSCALCERSRPAHESTAP